MKKQFIVLAFLLITFASCIMTKYRIFDSFVTSYFDFDKVGVDVTESGNIAIFVSDHSNQWNWYSKGKELKIYDSLCIVHNDVGYNTKLEYALGAPGPSFFKGDITTIEVWSDTGFNAEHPAGASLNNIVRFMAVSPYKHILSGYKVYHNWQNNFPEDFRSESLLLEFQNSSESIQYYINYGHPNELHPVNRKLSDAAASDFVLLDILWLTSGRDSGEKEKWYLGVLKFDERPSVPGNHEITVKITLSDGRVFTPKVNMVFE